MVGKGKSYYRLLNTQLQVVNMRYDKQGHILITGERQRKNLTYEYRWSSGGVCHSLYFPTLKQLRHTVYGIVLEDTIDELDETMKKIQDKYGEGRWIW